MCAQKAIGTLVCCFLTVAVIVGQSNAPSPPTIALPSDLAKVLTDYESAYPRGGAALAPLFAEDGFVLAGGRPAIRGRAAIADYYGPGRGELALRAFAYAMSGDVAYILGGYAARRGEPDGGKFTLTLRRQPDGRWLIVSDMDNGNSRPPRPQP
jgi:ketosteroid isomerase-like protein